jgi:nucleoside 2-deoxyribosyltransferase
MSKIAKVYLSGPMYLGRDQATAWRDEFKEFLDKFPYSNFDVMFECIDPCARFFENKRVLLDNAAWIVKIDKMEIANSDIVVVNASDPGWGTPMEHYIAWDSGKFVIAFDNKQFSSIWTKAHSHVVVDSHMDAARWLCKHASEFRETL